MITFRAALVAASLFAGCAAAPAQQATHPCSAPEYRQLDFWVGEWDLEYDQPDGKIGTATNTITNDEFGACAVIENFEMPNGYRGSSYSMYDRFNKTWRQMWVDNGGATFVLVGGAVSGKSHLFEFNTVERVGRDQLMRRMIWQDVTPTALTWRWQAQQADATWKDEWVLRYRKRANSSASQSTSEPGTDAAAQAAASSE